MAMVVPLASRQRILRLALNIVTPEDLYLNLYVNNYTPVSGSTAANFTAAAGGGYAAKSLAAGTWTITTDGVDDGQADYTAQTFTFTGALTGTTTIYGYYVTGQTSGLLLWAERFASSDQFTPAQNGDALTFTPKIRCGDLA